MAIANLNTKMNPIQEYVLAHAPDSRGVVSINRIVHIWLAMNAPMSYLPVHLRQAISHESPILPTVANWLAENPTVRYYDIRRAYLDGTKRRVYMADHEAFGGLAKSQHVLGVYPEFYVKHEYEQLAIRAANYLNGYRNWSKGFIFAGQYSYYQTKWQHGEHSDQYATLLVSEVAHNEVFRVEEL